MKEQFQITAADTLRAVMTKVWHCVCRAWDEASDGSGLKITVQSARLRNLNQNAAMWAALADIAEQIDWHGIKLTPEEWKDLLSAGLRKSKVVPNIDGTGFVIVGQRTSELSVKQMGDLLELIHAFGAEHGVRFSAPKQGSTPAKRLNDAKTIDGQARRVAE